MRRPPAKRRKTITIKIPRLLKAGDTIHLHGRDRKITEIEKEEICGSIYYYMKFEEGEDVRIERTTVIEVIS